MTIALAEDTLPFIIHLLWIIGLMIIGLLCINELEKRKYV